MSKGKKNPAQRSQPKRKSSKRRTSQRKTAKRQPSLREIYAKYRREFSAADLQKYTVVEEGVPADEVLQQMQEIHRKVTSKRSA